MNTIACQIFSTICCSLLAEGSTLISIVMIRYLAEYLTKPEHDVEEEVILVSIFSCATIIASLARNYFFFLG